MFGFVFSVQNAECWIDFNTTTSDIIIYYDSGLHSDAASPKEDCLIVTREQIERVSVTLDVGGPQDNWLKLTLELSACPSPERSTSLNNLLANVRCVDIIINRSRENNQEEVIRAFSLLDEWVRTMTIHLHLFFVHLNSNFSFCCSVERVDGGHR